MSFYHGLLLRLVHAVIFVKIWVVAWICNLKKAFQYHPKRTRMKLKNDSKTLKKLPLHIGIVVVEDDVSFPDISNIVVWCMALGISFISLYDTAGIFKRNCDLLNDQILKKQEEILGEETSSYSYQIYKSGAKIKSKGEVNRIHINLISTEDGRHDIVSIARIFCQDIASKRRKIQELDSNFVARELQGSHFPDPDLVLKFGAVDSLLGFLPYQMRLTEILSASSHYRIDYNSFFTLVRTYAGTEQRCGK
ncbi:dehydrodolichyl diphosphate synthase complex subunit Nus1-like isoform X1 [Glandiceps talaboti]